MKGVVDAIIFGRRIRDLFFESENKIRERFLTGREVVSDYRCPKCNSLLLAGPE